MTDERLRPVPPYNDDRGDLQEAWERGYRAALAATPEPPTLDAAYVRKVLGDHHRLLRTSARNCSICWRDRARLSQPTQTPSLTHPEV